MVKFIKIENPYYKLFPKILIPFDSVTFIGLSTGTEIDNTDLPLFPKGKHDDKRFEDFPDVYDNLCGVFLFTKDGRQISIELEGPGIPVNRFYEMLEQDYYLDLGKCEVSVKNSNSSQKDDFVIEE